MDAQHSTLDVTGIITSIRTTFPRPDENTPGPLMGSILISGIFTSYETTNTPHPVQDEELATFVTRREQIQLLETQLEELKMQEEHSDVSDYYSDATTVTDDDSSYRPSDDEVTDDEITDDEIIDYEVSDAEVIIEGGAPELMDDLEEIEDAEICCPICYETAGIITLCDNSHKFCMTCIRRLSEDGVYTELSGPMKNFFVSCPVCRILCPINFEPLIIRLRYIREYRVVDNVTITDNLVLLEMISENGMLGYLRRI
jgi:hypothetical protein